MVLEAWVPVLVEAVAVWVEMTLFVAVWTVLRQVVAVEASGAVLRRTRA